MFKSSKCFYLHTTGDNLIHLFFFFIIPIVPPPRQELKHRYVLFLKDYSKTPKLNFMKLHNYGFALSC